MEDTNYWVELDLLKITDSSGKIMYQALSEDESDDVLATESAYTYIIDPELRAKVSFKAEILGTVYVSRKSLRFRGLDA